jgi:aspartate/tyrosine/aromatic aminotransferase
MTITVATLACTGALKCAAKLMHVLSSDATSVPYGVKSVKVNLFYF